MKGKAFFIILLFLYCFIGEGSEDILGDYLLRKTFSHSDIVFLVFASRGGDFLDDVPSFEFCKSLAKYEENQIFIRDVRNKCYQWGLVERGNVSSTLKMLKEEILSLHPKKILVMGCSSGGYAALLFGALLLLDDFPVSEIYAFAPRDVHSLLETKEFFKELVAYPYFEPQFSSLRTFFKDKTFRKGIFHVYYCEGYERDHKYVQNCLNFDWINLHIVEGRDHKVALHLKERGLLQNIIDSAVENAKEYNEKLQR